MLSKAHKRRFGVEIECGLPGGPNAARRLLPGWNVGADGSGVEVRTKILQGEEGFKTLRNAMNVLKERGGYVTDRDGMHVHHDAPEFVGDRKKCLLLVESWNNNLEAIHEMVAPRRRRSGACPRWQAEYVDVLRRWSESTSGYLSVGRNDLNLLALQEHGSIEIRLHEGTLDPDVAVAWVMFGQRFLASVLKRAQPLKKAMSDTSLTSSLRLSKEAKRILFDKRMANHRTQGSMYR